MINRESARTVAEIAPPAAEHTLRKSPDTATASERMVYLKLCQGTNFK